MKSLSIDYGTKRIGVALSDEGGTLAFPKEILPNRRDLFEKLKEIIKEENVSSIVVGESLDYAGEANKVMREISEFVEKLKADFSLPVHFEKEFLTSVEARRYHKNGEKVDASAAALILQRYLDRINKKDF